MLLNSYVFRVQVPVSPRYKPPCGDYNRMSGGFPHSDISGSKPIPGSPKLNAGYHVLHRLLLPRHPPNALFALDLTRKEQGRWFKWPASLRRQKSYTYPCVQRTRLATQSPHTVSVLDLEQYHHRGRTPGIPILGAPDDTDVSHSKRCQFHPKIGRSNPAHRA